MTDTNKTPTLPQEAANEIEQLRAKVAELEKDVERLDFIQQTTKGYGTGWVFRESVSGRGMRLHETGENGLPSVREAIDQAMKDSD